MINTREQYDYTLKVLTEAKKILQVELESIEVDKKLIHDRLGPTLDHFKIRNDQFIRLTTRDFSTILDNKNTLCLHYVAKEKPILLSDLKEYQKVLIKYDDVLDQIHAYNILLRKINRITKYSNVTQIINKAIVREVLVNGSYSFGLGLSTIFIRERELGTESKCKKVRDWKTTNEKRTRLLKEGKTLYSNENPEGEKYISFYNETYDYWWGWRKAGCRFNNVKYFSFQPTNSNNFHTIPEGKKNYTNKSRVTQDFINTCKTTDDIIDSNVIGTIQKLFYLLNFDEDWHLRYKRNRHH